MQLPATTESPSKLARIITAASGLLLLSLLATFVPPARAQSAPKSARKVVLSVKPDYPEALKLAQIGGLVRLSVTVQPNGTVSHVEVRGGNPILAEKAQEAVLKWKYAPGATQSVEEVSLSFSPH